MYAAAGGASCRNARRRQAVQIKQDKEAQAKALKEKLAAAEAAKLAAHPKSRGFHQLPANYLRTPYSSQRKLSAGYTGHSSKLLLPINEQSAQLHRSPSQQAIHRHNFHHPNEPIPLTPSHHPHHRGDTRLDVDHKKLSRSATASFPLASHQHGTPPASPGYCLRQQQQFCFKQSSNLLSAHHHPIQIQIPGPNDGGIIITPATPLPSPSPTNHQSGDHKTATDKDEMLDFPLERACSVYRNRKLGDETTLEMEDEEKQQQYYPGGMPNGNSGSGGGHHTHWADEYCDAENRTLGVCTCDHIEVISFCLFPLRSFLCRCVVVFNNGCGVKCSS